MPEPSLPGLQSPSPLHGVPPPVEEVVATLLDAAPPEPPAPELGPSHAPSMQVVMPGHCQSALQPGTHACCTQMRPEPSSPGLQSPSLPHVWPPVLLELAAWDDDDALELAAWDDDEALELAACEEEALDDDAL